VIFRRAEAVVTAEEKTAIDGSLPAGFRAFQSRVSPIPAFAIRATTSCAKCDSLFETRVFLAPSRRLEPATIVESGSTVCGRCSAAQEARSP
jgi:hypothetical protein